MSRADKKTSFQKIKICHKYKLENISKNNLNVVFKQKLRLIKNSIPSVLTTSN